MLNLKMLTKDTQSEAKKGQEKPVEPMIQAQEVDQAAEKPQPIHSQERASQSEPHFLDQSLEGKAPSTESPPDHFDSLISEQEEVEHQQELSGDNALSEDDFIEFYASAFSFSSGITGIKSIAMEQADPNVKNGLGALYRISGRYRFLNWMRKPGGDAVMDFLAVGTLFGGMAMNVSAEMQARKNKPAANKPAAAEKPMPSMTLREMAKEQGA